MAKQVRAVLIPVAGQPEEIFIEDTLRAMQEAVEGLIEPVDVLWGDEPLLWVNDEGMYTKELNRVLLANERMAEMGYQARGKDGIYRTVGVGDPFCALFGPILAVSYDVDPETGEDVARDMTDEEVEAVMSQFARDAGTIFAEIAGLDALMSQTPIL